MLLDLLMDQEQYKKLLEEYHDIAEYLEADKAKEDMLGIIQDNILILDEMADRPFGVDVDRHVQVVHLAYQYYRLRELYFKPSIFKF